MRVSKIFPLALPWLLVSGPLLAGEDIEPAVRTSNAAAPAGAVTVDPASADRAPHAAAASAPAVPTVPAGAAAPGSSTPGQKASSAAAAKSSRAGGPGRAQDRVELENTEITGNRELPKVMYVVPWKRPDLGDFGGRPAKSLLDEVLEPVDRDVFRRQNQYFAVLQPDAASSAASPPAAHGGAAQNEK